jgi:hypothetical protein
LLSTTYGLQINFKGMIQIENWYVSIVIYLFYIKQIYNIVSGLSLSLRWYNP